MTENMSRRIVTGVAPGLLLGLGLAVALPSHRAAAQMGIPSPTAMGPVVQSKNGGPAPQPSVAGLPGARATAPVKQGPIDADLLSPTAELFDAINRGDISAARDALARGADLNAKDAVGQTPVDVSIQLGRNNITFLLVTLMKAGDTQFSEPQGAMNQPPANVMGLSAKDAQAASTPVSFLNGPAPKATASRHPARAQTASTAPRPSTSQDYAAASGGSGTPVPSAGFVGFGASAQ
jgi:hypothetical protein